MRDQLQPPERPLTQEEAEWNDLSAPRPILCTECKAAEPTEGADQCDRCLETLATPAIFTDYIRRNAKEAA